jgi:hypothetical protein
VSKNGEGQVKKLWLFYLLFAISLPVSAGSVSDPFYIANRSPLMVNSGLPGRESAQLLAPGKYSIGLFLDVATNATDTTIATEEITLDGETSHADLQLRYGFRENWELGLDLVWLRHHSGHLDDFIKDWHDFFHLPNGDRVDQPHDRLLYYYQKEGQVQLDHQQKTSGLGDTRLTAAYQLRNEARSQLAIRGGIEFDTGDADDLLGSGSTDLYLELVSRRVLAPQKYALMLHSGIGVLKPGDGEILAQQQKDWAGYGFVGLDWGISDAIHLKLQLNGHTSLFDGDVEELEEASVQLIMGGTARPGKNWLLDLSVSEDLLGETPDITFQMGIRYQLTQ